MFAWHVSLLSKMYSIWKDQDSHMAGYHQQDAHEFFVVLLQGFHTGWKGTILQQLLLIYQ